MGPQTSNVVCGKVSVNIEHNGGYVALVLGLHNCFSFGIGKDYIALTHSNHQSH